MGVPLAYNLRNLVERKATTLMTAAGIALTVCVLVIAMSLMNGLRAVFASTGHPLQAVVMRKGSTAELNSSVSDSAYQLIKLLPGLATLDDGQTMASGEVISVINLPSVDSPSGMNVTVRGLLPAGVKMRNLSTTAGRWFQPGLREVVVGKSIAKRYPAASLGSTLKFGRGRWQVVGVFDGGQSAVNSEIWCDLNQLSADFDRQGNMSSVLIRAKSPADLDNIISAIKDNKQLNAEAVKEQAYYASLTSAGQPMQVQVMAHGGLR